MTGPSRVPLVQRFWSRVRRSNSRECWAWEGSRTSEGYGYISVDGKNRRVHRVAWELVYGPIPEGAGYHGTCVLHRCDNRSCVNPAHLFLGSNRDNANDRDAKGRQALGECNGKSKLTAANVRTARMLRSAGVTYREIGDLYGVGRVR